MCFVCRLFTTFAVERKIYTDMASVKNENMQATLDTLRTYAGASTDAGLAAILGISRERLRQWRLREVYDVDVI